MEFVAAAGTALSAISALQQGLAAEDAAQFNARQAEINAQAARDQAAFDAERGEEKARRLRAANVARTASSGTALASPSRGELFLQNAEDVALEIEAIRRTGENRARGFESQAALDRAQGRAARTGGLFGAGATLLSGAEDFQTAGSSFLRLFEEDDIRPLGGSLVPVVGTR
jgi:hypothetical protein